MSTRRWIILLLLLNYLLVVGMGCVNRPGDEIELVEILTHQEGNQAIQCRYMRMDGLESFMLESIGRRDKSESGIPDHHLISVVSGVHVHELTESVWQLLPPLFQLESPSFAYQLSVSDSLLPIISTPPWHL